MVDEKTRSDPHFGAVLEELKLGAPTSGDSAVLVSGEVVLETGTPRTRKVTYRVHGPKNDSEIDLWIEKRDAGYRIETINVRRLGPR